MNPGVDSHTPHLTVIDGRGLPVRQVAYCRRDVSTLVPERRVTAQQQDAAGRLVAQRDPRLLAPTERPNLSTVYSLSGTVLLTDSVDAGWRLGLPGEAAQVLERWDGRGSHWQHEFDEQRRPTAMREQTRGAGATTVERLTYADNAPEFAEHNQCGQLIRHDDSAGTQWFAAFGLTGGLLEQTRQFLSALDAPDWPEPVADRGKLLEPGVGATTRSRFNPLGEVIEQTDAKTNRQFFSQTVAGQLREVRLQLPTDPAPKTLVSEIQYNAHGQIERETAGNGVLTTLEYAAEDGRLSRLQAKRGNDDLQNLHYEYDPVGNVLSIDDAALPIRYFANQRIEPINRYGYDSLYQLIEATGWEAGAAHQGPSSSTSADPAAVGNYRQTYRYDAGNNLLELTHVGPQNPGHRLAAAAYSNRCLPVRNGVEPGEEDFRNGFDANGNLLNLQPGQALSWDLRNQLREVRPVERDSGVDDSECYVYGADGMRVRKVRSTHTKAQTLTAEVRYLPNLELRTHSGTGEDFQVISVQAGRGSVRVLHWEAQRPAQIANDQQRYSLSDHLGSSTLELDQDAKVISQERYYPFGGTAWADGEAVQVSYKTVRYSGKERDATGLYYYGFRYYVAGWQRWLSPDPAGASDGLNFYGFCGNNPISRIDPDGRMWQQIDDNLRSEALDQFLDNEQSLRAEYRLSPISLRYSEQDDDEPMDYQESPDSLQGHDSSSELSPGFPSSPDSPPPPTADQNTLIDMLNKGTPQLRYDWNNRNLLVRENFGGKVYRADRREPDDVLRDGFDPSDEFTAVKKMISGSALIVAETLEGAQFYAAQSGDRYYFYEIDATDVSGASLLENLEKNSSRMVVHLDAYPDSSPSNQTGQANRMYEAHLSHDDLTYHGRPIVSLGPLPDEVNRVRRTMNL